MMGKCLGCLQATQYLKHFTASTTANQHDVSYQYSGKSEKNEKEHFFDVPLDSDDD